MRIAIFMGSARVDGNTAELCKPFVSELQALGAEVSYTVLVNKRINPCKSCNVCQQVSGVYGCVQTDDDMSEIIDEIIKADVIVFATPIYTWYCPAEMKALLDRHYGLNKYYGKGTGSLWLGKSVAIIATHGYEREYAAEPFETGIKRLCEHSKLKYIGMYSVRDTDYKEEDYLASFQTPEAVEGVKAFARELLQCV